MAKKKPIIIEDKFKEYNTSVLNAMLQNVGVKLDFLYAILIAKDLSALKKFHTLFPDTLLFDNVLTGKFLVNFARYDHNEDLLKYYLTKAKHIFEKDNTGNALLAEAALYGAEKNVVALLDAGFNPNFSDANGQTALHKAAYTPNAIIMKLLVQKGNVNCQDNSGCTPLHYAKAFNEEVTKVLLSKQPKKDLLTKQFQLNYIKFAEKCKKGEIPLTKPELQKEFFSDKNPYFHKAKAAIFKVIVEPTQDRLLAQEQLDIAIENLKKIIDPFLKNDDMDNFDILHQSLGFLSAINSIYRMEGRASLKEDIINAAKKSMEFIPNMAGILCEHYSHILVESLEEGDHLNVRKYGNLAIELINQNPSFIPTNTQEEAFYNLGVALEYLDPEKALKYFNEAEKLNPDNKESILHKFQIYTILCKFNEASKELDKLGDTKLKVLFSTYISLFNHQYSSAELKSFKLPDEPSSLEEYGELKQFFYRGICSSFFQEIGDQDGAIKHYQFLVDKFPTPKVRLVNITKILSIYHANHDFAEGLKFLQECESKYDETTQTSIFFPEFTFYKFILYEANNKYSKANEALEILKENYVLGDLALSASMRALEIRIITDFQNYNFDSFKENLSFLQKIAGKPTGNNNNEFSLNSNIIQWCKNLESLMLNNLQKLFNQPSSPKEELPEITDEEPEANFASIEWMMTEQEGVSSLNQQQIHQYFTRQKQALLSIRVEDLKHSTAASWQVGKVAFKDGKKNVLSIEGKANFYATIDERVLEKNDLKTQELSSFALKKGEVSKSFKSVGIKFLKGVVELKINEGNRLYTNVIYKNLDGKYLIIFDHKGNHGDVTKANKIGLKIINVKMHDHLSKAEKPSDKSSDLDDYTNDIDLDNNNNSENVEEVDVLGNND